MGIRLKTCKSLPQSKWTPNHSLLPATKIKKSFVYLSSIVYMQILYQKSMQYQSKVCKFQRIFFSTDQPIAHDAAKGLGVIHPISYDNYIRYQTYHDEYLFMNVLGTSEARIALPFASNVEICKTNCTTLD